MLTTTSCFSFISVALITSAMANSLDSSSSRVDFSSLGALKEDQDARFTYTISGNFSNLNVHESYTFDVYMRKSSHGNHLLFFDSFEKTEGGSKDFPVEELDSLKLPFIAVVRNGFLRSMYTWPNETQFSLLIKGELNQLLARDFSSELNQFVELETRPSIFTFKRDIEDTPVGRGCYGTELELSSGVNSKVYALRGRVERSKCEEVFTFSSTYEASPDSFYDFNYYYDQETFEFRGVDTQMLITRAGSGEVIELNNKLNFVEYVPPVKIIDDTKLKRRWAGIAELWGYLYGAGV